MTPDDNVDGAAQSELRDDDAFDFSNPIGGEEEPQLAGVGGRQSWPEGVLLMRERIHLPMLTKAGLFRNHPRANFR